jgi:hypothetical protein
LPSIQSLEACLPGYLGLCIVRPPERIGQIIFESKADGCRLE